jgi:hypothetical protein
MKQMATSWASPPSQPGIAGEPRLDDARWFAADLHVPDRRFTLRWLDEDVIARSSFLDTRIEAPPDPGVAVDAAAVDAAALPAAPVGWLFHTSFCASTLLARCLHLAPAAIALKEPLMLRRLSDARHAGWALDGLVAPVVALLARPWHAGGAVVIKPTHVALNLAADLLGATPGSRALIVTSSLADFLISNLKKSPESQAKIPLLVERALRATGFAARLPDAAQRPPDLICAAGLQWAAQQELVRDVIAAVGAERVRVLDLEPLLADLPAAAAASARWLGLAVPTDAIALHAREIGLHNAKQTQTPYGPERRAYEAGLVGDRYRDALRRARDWLHAHVVPAMRAAAPPALNSDSP